MSINFIYNFVMITLIKFKNVTVNTLKYVNVTHSRSRPTIASLFAIVLCDEG